MKRTAMLGLLALVSWSAQAHDAQGWRVGLAASFANLSWTQGDLDLINDSSIGGKGYAQYQFNDWFGVEGSYYNTGDFEDLVQNSQDPSKPDGRYKLGLSGFSAVGLFYIPVPSEDIQIYLKGGYYDFDSQLSFNGTTSSYGSEDGLTLGGGAMIDITDRFGIRADVDWFDADIGDLWAVNLGVEYHFGGKSEPAAAATPPPPPPPPPVEEAPAPAAAPEAAPSP